MEKKSAVRSLAVIIRGSKEFGSVSQSRSRSTEISEPLMTRQLIFNMGAVQSKGEQTSEPLTEEEEKAALAVKTHELFEDVFTDVYSNFSWTAFSVFWLYYLLGVFLSKMFESAWTWTDCFYFTAVTLSTVGYGDFSPSTGAFKVIWSFYMVGGLCFVASLLTLVRCERACV